MKTQSSNNLIHLNEELKNKAQRRLKLPYKDYLIVSGCRLRLTSSPTVASNDELRKFVKEFIKRQKVKFTRAYYAFFSTTRKILVISLMIFIIVKQINGANQVKILLQ